MEKIAYIREAECIGCVKCVLACSDNAILGARKQMHTILTDLCTGCEDCIAPCPVDCIEMIEKPAHLLVNHLATAQQPAITHATLFVQAAPSPAEKKALIAAAMERVKAKQAQRQGTLNDATPVQKNI